MNLGYGAGCSGFRFSSAVDLGISVDGDWLTSCWDWICVTNTTRVGPRVPAALRLWIWTLGSPTRQRSRQAKLRERHTAQ